MQVIKPLEINDSNLTSTIAEPDLTHGETEWSSSRDNFFDVGGGKNSKDVVIIGGVIYSSSTSGSGEINTYTLDGVSTGGFTVIGDPIGIDTDGSRLIYLWPAAVGDTDIDVYEVDFDGLNNNLLFTITLPTSITFDNAYFAYFNNAIYVVRTNTGESFIYSFDASSGLALDSYDASPLFSMTGISKSDDGFYVAKGQAIYRSPSDLSSFDFVYSHRIDNKVRGGLSFKDGRIWSPADLSGGGSDVIGYTFEDGDAVDKYQTGERVIKASTHKIYQATANTSDDPEVGVNLKPPTWAIVSATNKYRAFDYVKNLQSSGPSPLVIDIDPSQIISALAVFNISGASTVNVTMTDPIDGVVYDKDIDMVDVTGIVNMWQYFFYKHVFIDKFVVDDLPPYKNATLTITFTGDADILIGEVATGRGRIIGKMVKGSSSDRKSYSTITTDDFGSTDVTVRPSATYTNYMTSLSTSTAAYVERVLKESLDVPTIFIGDDWNNVKLVDLGYYERSPLVRQNPSLSEINIKVRGLV